MSDLRKWKALVESASKKLTEDPVADADYTDHEVSMAKSQMLSSMKSINRIAKHLSSLSESEGLEGWTASKLTMAEDYLQAVADYFDGKEINEASTVNGVNMDGKKRWKSTQLSYDDAIAKYGKDNVKKGMFKRRNGEDDVQVYVEGYKIMPPMDPKYVARDGLEGPFSTLSGKVVYYDPKEGKYYDPDTDMYMSYDEFQNYDKDYSGMKDERSEVKEAQLQSFDWPDKDEDGDSEMEQHAYNAIRHDMHAYDAFGHVYSMTKHRDWMDNNKEELIKMFASYGLQTESLEESEALTEEQFDEAAGEKDACYHKVKSRYKVWPSAYASGALVKCRKVGAKNWGNSKKK